MKKPPSGLQTTVSQLLAGMDANNDALAARGATPEFVKSGQTLLDKLASLESERDKLMDTLKAQQEAAKAAIKAKKAAIAVTRAQLRTWKGESTRVVKRTYRGEREKWLDFGLPVKIAKAKKKKKSKK